MTVVVSILLGVVAGCVGTWLWASTRIRQPLVDRIVELQGRAAAAESVRDELRQQVELQRSEISGLRTDLANARIAATEAQTRFDSATQNLAEQKRILDEAASRLSDAFKALSADALKSNNQAFLDLAKQALNSVTAEATGDIGKRQEAIDALIRPLQEMLKRHEQLAREIEEKRQVAYGGVEAQLTALRATQEQLHQETGQLVAALRTPRVRGRWGEMTLHRTVELAGMVEHCDYIEQVTVESENGRLRPDMVVKLPADREIVVDSKVPLDGYLDALAAPTDEERRQALEHHAQQVRTHLNQLATKSYWEQFTHAPEFVVMFIPGEAFFAAAVEFDHTLIEDGMAKRVVLATPTTLIALLLAVEYGWRQEALAEHATAISELGKQLHDRLKILAEHFLDMGKALERAVSAYNRAVGSIESRVLITARKFHELRAAGGDEIPRLEAVEHVPRALIAPDLDVDGHKTPGA